MRIGAVCVLLVAGTCVLMHAQQPSTPQPVFRAGVSIVEVSAVVTDRAGQTIGDLTTDDFEVFEDGQPRPVTSFRRLVAGQRDTRRSVFPVDGARIETLATNVGVADAPAFVLVLDDLNTSPFDAHRAIRAGLGVLGAIPEDALVAVVTTSGVGGSLLTLTPPGPEHAARVREFRGRVLLVGPKDRAEIQTKGSSVDAPCGVGSAVPQSQDCGDPTRAARRAEVIDAVARILSRAGSRRKVVFWVTEDMGVSPLDPRGNQAAQRAALERVLNADVAIYPVNPREGHADMRSSAVIAEGDRGDNRPDRRSGGLMRVGPGDTIWNSGPGTTVELNTDEMVAVTLDQVARESGGRWITNANDLDAVLAEVVVQNTTSYLLAFEAQATQTPGRHRIDVRVRRDGARVFARRGYVVPEAVASSAAPGAETGAAGNTSALLRDIALGTVPQGQLAMTVQVVPEFAVGRTGRALVSVRLDATTAGDGAVDLVLLSIDDEGKVGQQQGFRLTPPDAGAEWALSTPLTLARGTHQVRVAAVTTDGARSGLVITPVEIIEPGNDLLMAPPVLLGGTDSDGIAPTLARTFETGTPLGAQVDVAGRAVRDGTAVVVASVFDAQGQVAREVDAVVERAEWSDRLRATAIVTTAGMTPGDYTLVLEARGPAGTRTVRHAVPVTVTSAAVPPAPTSGSTSPAATSGTVSATTLKPLSVAHGPTTSADPGVRVIRDEASWVAFWMHLPTRQPPPDIDFARVTLLALVVDAEATSPMHPVVDRIERDGDAAVVHWRTAPATSTGAPEPAGATRPFAVVGVIGHDGPIRFEPVP